VSGVLAVLHGQREGRSVPSQWINLMMVSRGRVESNQGGLASVAKVGSEVGASVGRGNGINGERSLMT
jgi:hypothetical protein